MCHRGGLCFNQNFLTKYAHYMYIAYSIVNRCVVDCDVLFLIDLLRLQNSILGNLYFIMSMDKTKQLLSSKITI